MPENIDAIIRRVRKLLALAKSDNAHEAAAAAAQAQRLLTLHGLEASQIEDRTEPVTDGGVLHSGANLEKWALRLAAVIAEANQCRALVITWRADGLRLRDVNIYGRPSDLAKVRYLFEYYLGETKRLALAHGRGRGRSWLNNFKHGVVDTLGRALITAVKDAAAEVSSTALVHLRSRGDDVEAFVKATNNVKGHADTDVANQDLVARYRGQLAGRSIAINTARAAVGGGS
jgi:hypothetical protein